jgi:hypothetical protein
MVIVRGSKKVTVARMVANAKEGERVQHLDRDPLNLKRDNLLVSGGPGKSTARDTIVRPHTFLRHKVELKHEIIPSWERAE